MPSMVFGIDAINGESHVWGLKQFAFDFLLVLAVASPLMAIDGAING